MANMQQSNTGNRERTFRCSDAGFKGCNWKTSGRSDNEIIDRAREHGRQAHGITNFDDNMKRKVQDNIHDRLAA
jgi:predicted small metal-binding protein